MCIQIFFCGRKFSFNTLNCKYLSRRIWKRMYHKFVRLLSINLYNTSFGGCSLHDDVDHVLWCLSHACSSCCLSSLEYWCLYVLCVQVLLSSCYLCTYDLVLQMDCITEKANQIMLLLC